MRKLSDNTKVVFLILFIIFLILDLNSLIYRNIRGILGSIFFISLSYYYIFHKKYIRAIIPIILGLLSIAHYTFIILN